jgi:hypothetical protein
MKTKSVQGYLWILPVLLLAVPWVVWISCSGGGGGASSPVSPPGSPKLLRWDAPTQFADGGALDPAKDLSSYEVFINETGGFLPTDTPRAVIPAVDAASGNPVTSFNLSTIRPALESGKTYFLTMRSVEKTGGKSPLALPAVQFVY